MNRASLLSYGFGVAIAILAVSYGLVFFDLLNFTYDSPTDSLEKAGVFTEDIFADGTDSSLPPVDCQTVCAKLFECGLVDDRETCTNDCFNEFPRSLRTCIVEEVCDRIEPDCYSDQNKFARCEQACDRMDLCGLMDPELCLVQCADFEEAEISCLLATGCSNIEPDCFGIDADQLCEPYCDKMMLCDLLAPTDLLDCLSECIDRPAQQTECVLDAECEMIPHWCFTGTTEPKCVDFCSKLAECDPVGPEDYDDCVLDCAEEMPSLVECVLFTDCDQIDFCYDSPFAVPDCHAYCDHLIECGLYDPLELTDCWQDCEIESPEVVWCTLQSLCDRIESDCLSNPLEVECRQVCDRLAQCGVSDIEPSCDAACMDEFSQDTVDCILQGSCDRIVTECLESQCSQACAGLYECGLIESVSECGLVCLDQWSDVQRQCVLESDCANAEAACF